MTQPILAGVRVLDFGRYIAAPFCAALLADLGAEVIRVEPSAGGDDRFVMPVTKADEGALFLQNNRNKQSLTLNLDRPGADEVIRRLVAHSDVVVANLVPALMTRMGLDYDKLKAIRPDIILTTITAYDAAGPQKNSPGFDGTGQATSGSMYLTGYEGQPLRCAVSYVDYSTGLSAAYGTMAALLWKAQSGQGQHVQASLMQTALTMTNPMLIEEASGARTRQPSGNRSPISGPNDLFPTADNDWVLVQVAGQEMFARWCAMVGRPELVDDPRYDSDLSRGENGATLSAIMSDWTRARTTLEALDALRAARVPACTVLTPAQALADLKARPNPMFEWQTHKDLDAAIPVAGTPVRFSESPVQPASPAPELGQHTDLVLRSAGFSETEIEQLRNTGAV